LLNPSEKILKALAKNQFNYEFILKTFSNFKEGLKLRMENLQKSIAKTRGEVDEEKEKNIELLNMIFPSDIARKFWGGKVIIFISSSTLK